MYNSFTNSFTCIKGFINLPIYWNLFIRTLIWYLLQNQIWIKSPSFHPNSHHQLIFAKLNLKTLYSPTNFHVVWHFQGANNDLITQRIDMFDCHRAFVNINGNQKVLIFNRTIFNIQSIFIPHETLMVDDKEPPCFTKKSRINRKLMCIKAIAVVKTIVTQNFWGDCSFYKYTYTIKLQSPNKSFIPGLHID